MSQNLKIKSLLSNNLDYVTDRAETLGSTFYINKDGNINLAIVLQVIGYHTDKLVRYFLTLIY